METGQANSHSVYSRLESGQENRAQAAQERREPGEKANVGGKLEPPTEPNPWGHLVLDRDAGGQLKPPTVRGKRVLGRDKGQLKRENKRRKIERQLQQSDGVQYWKTHEANPEVRYIPRVPREHRGQMDPAGPALEHPAAHLLDEYATFGCPANTGKNWTLAELEAAIEVGPHVSAMVPEAMQQLQEEVTSKVANGQVKVFLWDDLKKTMPPKLKISRIAMIPHKSKPFRAILDLSFPIQFQDGTIAPVNETTTKTAPRGSMDQMGQTLQRLRSGGAQALSLAGYPDRVIQKMGRWRSATFLEYISDQLSSFSQGMSTNMAKVLNFVNIAGGVSSDVTNIAINTPYDTAAAA